MVGRGFAIFYYGSVHQEDVWTHRVPVLDNEGWSNCTRVERQILKVLVERWVCLDNGFFDSL